MKDQAAANAPAGRGSRESTATRENGAQNGRGAGKAAAAKGPAAAAAKESAAAAAAKEPAAKEPAAAAAKEPRTGSQGSKSPLGGAEKGPAASSAAAAEAALQQRRQERRKLSNRESARRSRQRKQAHLRELEEQRAQLANENYALRCQAAAGHAHLEAAVRENRELALRVAELRERLALAEQQGVGDNAAGGAPGFPFQVPEPLVDWHVHEQ